jgi:iron complex transport system ATP-binding protein
MRRTRDPEDPLTVIVSCEDSSELDIATSSLGSRAEPSVLELELPPHLPAQRGSKH